jgi:hypothetical protein
MLLNVFSVRILAQILQVQGKILKFKGFESKWKSWNNDNMVTFNNTLPRFYKDVIANL